MRQSEKHSTLPAESATRRRLIEAAGEIFAEHGFRSTTVRDICQRAGANVAAINYHFGDKKRLYAEVLRYAHLTALERHPYTSPEIAGQAAPARLVFYIEAFMQRLFDQGRPAWQGRLMAREMAEPTAALSLLVDSSIRPQFKLLGEIIRELLPEGSSRSDIELCARSVLGQCLFYHFGRPVLERLDGHRQDDPAYIRKLAGHITRFTLIALRSWSTTPVGKKRNAQRH